MCKALGTYWKSIFSNVIESLNLNPKTKQYIRKKIIWKILYFFFIKSFNFLTILSEYISKNLHIDYKVGVPPNRLFWLHRRYPSYEDHIMD